MEKEFYVGSKKRGSFLDPRTKLFVMFTDVVFVTGGAGMLPDWLTCALAVFPLVLLLIEREWKKAVIYGVIFVLAQSYVSFFLGKIPAAWGYLLTMCCVIIVRILLGLIMGGYIFSSTTVSEFIAAMEKMHVSNKISIPMSVMFRFFPTVMEEFFSINSAMKMRDICIGGKNMAKMVEYRLVPLMVCSVNIGNELAAAALTRGLNPDGKRTNICKIGFHAQDGILFFVMLVPYLVLILEKTGVKI